MDQNSQELASEQRTLEPGVHTVKPNASLVPVNYQLTSPGEVTVTVNELGADQTVVTFTYQIQPAIITVRYIGQNSQELASEQRTLEPGVHTVKPNASLVPVNYQLTSPGEVTVTVDVNGANPSEVIFVYMAPAATPEPTATPTPEPTPIPTPEPTATPSVYATVIKIYADSAQKLYDGQPLTAPGFTLRFSDNGLTASLNPDGSYTLSTNDVLSAVVIGSQTEVGSSENVIQEYIVKRGTTDVTYLYQFRIYSGTLEVK